MMGMVRLSWMAALFDGTGLATWFLNAAQMCRTVVLLGTIGCNDNTLRRQTQHRRFKSVQTRKWQAAPPPESRAVCATCRRDQRV
jgi:hypothetical protein